MRRTARALSLAFAAGAVLALTGPVASADPAARTSPTAVGPGGTVTVSVSCDPLTGPVPDTLDAASPAFADGTARLTRVTGTSDSAAGPVYRGTARIATGGAPAGGAAAAASTVTGTCPAASGTPGRSWSTSYDVTGSGDGGEGAGQCRDGEYCEGGAEAGAPPDGTGVDGGGQVGAGRDGAAQEGGGQVGAGQVGAGQDGAGRDNRDNPAQDSGGRDQSGHDNSGQDDHNCRDSHDTAGCAASGVDHGVEAGQGGSFSDSVPALAAGAACIAAACAGAGYRVYGRVRSTAGRPTGM
ncbi:hypothetical protein [Streptomyces sp. NPDC046727]|uniref:hypothetical protein n=1 Tax=Streptomyces sp. NPDC046727 TaxID=3155373 RepID=UPI0033DE5F76